MQSYRLFLLLSFLSTSTVAQQQSIYSKADSVALAYRPHRFTSANKIARTLTEPFETEQEKARVLFRWVTDNIRYDIKTYLKLKERNFRFPKKRFRNAKHKTRWRKRQYRRLVQGSLRRRKAVCEGYAELYAYLCNQAGVYAQVVSGHSRADENDIGRYQRPLHAWNAVRINGKLQLADPTWASGTVDEHRKLFTKEFRGHYYLTPPRQFAYNHFPEDPNMLLFHADSFQVKEFYQLPLPLDGYFTQKLDLIAPKNGRIRLTAGQPLRIRFWADAPVAQSSVLQIRKKRVGWRKYRKEFVPIDYQLIHLAPRYYELTLCPGEKGFAPLLIVLNHKPVILYHLGVKRANPTVGIMDN